MAALNCELAGHGPPCRSSALRARGKAAWKQQPMEEVQREVRGEECSELLGLWRRRRGRTLEGDKVETKESDVWPGKEARGQLDLFYPRTRCDRPNRLAGVSYMIVFSTG